MPVYVDHARNPFGRMIMSHMIADTIPELMAMACDIGLHHRHFQPKSHPHFDVSQSYRNKAVCLGAIEVGRKELVALMRQQRQRLATDKVEALNLQNATRNSDIGMKSSPR